jgi:dihydroneopterin aldolase
MDLDIELDANAAAQSDDIADTIDYAAVVADLRQCLAGKSYFLLERLAEYVAARILERFGARRVTVRVAKIAILEGVGRVGVTITRARRGG